MGAQASTFAEVYIYRLGSMPVWNADFFVDDEKVAALPSGGCSYTLLRVPAGTHTLKFSWPTHFKRALMFGLERKLKLNSNWLPDGKYYYSLNYRVQFREISTELARVEPGAAVDQIARWEVSAALERRHRRASPCPAGAGHRADGRRLKLLVSLSDGKGRQVMRASFGLDV